MEINWLITTRDGRAQKSRARALKSRVRSSPSFLGSPFKLESDRAGAYCDRGLKLGLGWKIRAQGSTHPYFKTGVVLFVESTYFRDYTVKEQYKCSSIVLVKLLFVPNGPISSFSNSVLKFQTVWIGHGTENVKKESSGEYVLRPRHIKI